MFRHNVRWPVILFMAALHASFAVPSSADEDAADPATVQQILQESRLVPLLPEMKEEPVQVELLPKFSAKKLAGYSFVKQASAARERAEFQADRDRYARDFPLRAAIFAAAETIQKLPPLKMAKTLAENSPMERAAALQRAKQVGLVIFELEEALSRMQEAADERGKETSRRWQANFACAGAPGSQPDRSVRIRIYAGENFAPTISRLKAKAIWDG